MKKRKRFLSWVLSLTMIFGIMPVFDLPIFAANSAGMSGAGTPQNPYIVKTQAQLESIGEGDADTCYRLDNDIYLAADSSFNTIESFKGYFDGNGKTIYNMKLQWEVDAQNEYANTYKALFGTIEKGALVRNFIIERPTVSAVSKYRYNTAITAETGILAKTVAGIVEGVKINETDIRTVCMSNNDPCGSICELGGFAYKVAEGGRIVNSFISGDVMVSDAKNFGGIAVEVCGTVANMYVEIDVNKVRGYGSDGYTTFQGSYKQENITPGVVYLRHNGSGGSEYGAMFNVWVYTNFRIAKLLDTDRQSYNGGSDVPDDTRGAYLVCLLDKESSTGSYETLNFYGPIVKNCYYDATTETSVIAGEWFGRDRWKHSNTTSRTTPGTWDKPTQYPTEFEAQYNKNATQDNYDIYNKRTYAPLLMPYNYSDMGNIVRHEFEDGSYDYSHTSSTSYELPYTTSGMGDEFVEYWTVNGVKTNSGETITLTPFTTIKAGPVANKYVPLIGDTTIMLTSNTTSLPYAHSYWKNGYPTKQDLEDMEAQVLAAKVNADNTLGEFLPVSSITTNSGESYCYKYIIPDKQGKLKSGTYKAYSGEETMANRATYKVAGAGEKIEITESNYTQYLDVNIPKGEVWRPNLSFDIPTVTPKDGGPNSDSAKLKMTVSGWNVDDIFETVELANPTDKSEYFPCYRNYEVTLKLSGDEYFEDAEFKVGNYYLGYMPIDFKYTINPDPVTGESTPIVHGEKTVIDVEYKVDLKDDGNLEFIKGEGTLALLIKNMATNQWVFDNSNNKIAIKDGKARITIPAGALLGGNEYYFVFRCTENPIAPFKTYYIANTLNGEENKLYNVQVPKANTSISLKMEKETPTGDTSYTYGEKIKFTVTADDNDAIRETNDVAIYSGENKLTLTGAKVDNKTYTYTGLLDVGTHDLVAKFDGGDYYNPADSNKIENVKISQAEIIPTFIIDEENGYTYGDEAKVKLTFSGFLNDGPRMIDSAVYVKDKAGNEIKKIEYSNISSSAVTNGLEVSLGKDLAAGDYVLSFDGTPYDANNYYVSADTKHHKEITIKRRAPKASDFSFETPDFVYDGTQKTVNVTAAADGTFDGTIGVNYKKYGETEFLTSAPIASGQYELWARVTGDTNYTDDYVQLIDKFSIAQKDITAADVTVKINGAENVSDVTYTGNKTDVEVTAKPDGAFNISGIQFYVKNAQDEYVPTTEPLINPGDYRVNITTEKNNDYAAANDVAIKEFKISKASPQIKFTAQPENNAQLLYDNKIIIEGIVNTPEGAAAPTGTISASVKQGMTSKAVASDKVEYEDGKFKITLIPGEDFVAGATYSLSATYGGNDYYSAKSEESNAFKINKSFAAFKVDGTEQIYEPGQPKTLKVTTPSLEYLLPSGIKIDYYLVNENKGELDSTDAVKNTISPGRYMYVISLNDLVKDNYQIEKEYIVGNVTIPDFSLFDNVGYMDIKSGITGQQRPISFTKGIVNLEIGQTCEDNELNNPNDKATVEYTSSNPLVATVDRYTGVVKALSQGMTVITAESILEGTTSVYTSYTVNVDLPTKTLGKDDFEIVANKKFYDTTDSVTISAKVKGDNNIKVDITGYFEDADAGKDKKVIYTINGISGTGSEHYVLGNDVNDKNVTATIEKAKVTIICAQTTTRIFDGNVQTVDVSAMASGAVFDVSNYTVLYNGEEAKADYPSATGEYAVTIALKDGIDKNYEVVQPNNTKLKIMEATQEVFSITGVPEKVSYGLSFDVSTDNTDGTVEFTVDDSTKASVTKDENGTVTVSAIGTGKVTLTATCTRNGYKTRTAVKTIDIQPRVIDIESVTAQERAYDGTVNVEIEDVKLANIVNDDDVYATNASGAMLTADAGDGKIVNVSGIKLAGDDAALYTLSSQNAQTTINIAPMVINNVTFESESRYYNNTDEAKVKNIDIADVLSADKSGVSLVYTAKYADKNAGSHTVTLTATDIVGSKAHNYELGKKSYTTTDSYDIMPMEITFSAGVKDFVYDDTDKKITVFASDKDGNVFDDYSLVYKDESGEIVQEARNAGTYTVEIVLGNSENYTTNQSSFEMTIRQATQSQLVIAGLPGTVQYLDSFTLTASGGLDGADVMWECDNDNVTLSSTTGDSVDVTIGESVGDTVTIKATKTDENYGDVFASVTFIPQRRNVVFELSGLEYTYGEQSPFTVKTEENVSYDVKYNGEDTQPTNAGMYAVTVTATENYQGSASGYLTIKKAEIPKDAKVVVEGGPFIYGGSNKPIAKVTGIDGIANEVDYNITYAGTGIYTEREDAPTNAGKYVAVAEISGDNYETKTIASDEFEIAKRELKVKAKNTERYYGESNPIFEFEYISFVNGDDESVIISEPTAVTDARPSSNVGDYPITVKGGRADNYVLVPSDDKGVLSVKAIDNAELYITGAPSSVYVNDSFGLHAYYGNGKVNAEWESLNPDVAEITASGFVKAKKAGIVTIKAKSDVYPNAEAAFDITVKKKDITLVVDDNVKVYNGEVQGISFVPHDDFIPILSGENANVQIKYAMSADPSNTVPKNAGVYLVTYVIKDESYSGGGNAVLHINKANVELKVASGAKVYGDAPTYTMVNPENVNGFTNEKLLSLVEISSDGEAVGANVGEYDIATKLKTASDDNCNYKLASENGKLTVSKAPLTIKVKDVSREYGAENPTPEYEIEGFKNEETKDVLTGDITFNYADTVTAESPVRTYDDVVTAVSTFANDNYEVLPVVYEDGAGADLTITEILVNASAASARSSYLTIKFDKAIEGLTADNFVVKNGEERITLTDVTASDDNMTYTLNGSFSTSVTYSVDVTLAGFAIDATHEIVSGTLSIKPSSSGSGGGGGGGIPAAATYTVKFETNGGSKIDSVKVEKNNTVTEPDEPTKDGYKFDGWYTDKKLTKAYDFSTKVTKAITLYAKWTEKEVEPTEPAQPTEPAKPDEWVNPFTDVKSGEWYYEGIKYVAQKGLMNGIADTMFAPNDNLTRAMLVTILYRAEGEPEVDKSISFNDVDMDGYYANAVIWGQKNGIIEGHTENEFAPDENITREQIAAIMHRYASYKGYDVTADDASITDYADYAHISDYAKDAMLYAVSAGLINGKTDTTLNPKDNATRAEIAAILQRFIEANK